MIHATITQDAAGYHAVVINGDARTEHDLPDATTAHEAALASIAAHREQHPVPDGTQITVSVVGGK